MKFHTFVALLSVLLTSSRAQEKPQLMSEALIEGMGAFRGRINGRIVFTQRDCSSPVHINGIVQGLPPGLHGFHVHEKQGHAPHHGATIVGMHLNPFKNVHGALEDKNRHVGDWGNVLSEAARPSPIAYISKIDPVTTLCEGPRGINHHAVMIHRNEDDLGRGANFESLVTGNSGPPIATGFVRPMST